MIAVTQMCTDPASIRRADRYLESVLSSCCANQSVWTAIVPAAMMHEQPFSFTARLPGPVSQIAVRVTGQRLEGQHIASEATVGSPATVIATR